MTESAVFIVAVKLHDSAVRAAYLAEACGDDAALRLQVEELLRLHDQGSNPLDRPALAPAQTVDEVPPNGPANSAPLRELRPAEGVGSVIAGRYKLLQQIGEGGMGSVFMAEQTRPVKRMVAIKVIKAGMDSRQVLARFESERQALALMDHPNIAKVLDAGTTPPSPPSQGGAGGGGLPFFVMELVKGVPLTQFCDDRQLSVGDRLKVFQQICHAVQHAHQKGIIHRDLKPTNILVESHDGRPVPKVINFGLAKAVSALPLTDRSLFTNFGSILGTPLYMAPEQAELSALDVDTRADIYALGVILYELLTGTTPLEKKRFAEAAWDEIRRVIKEEEPPKPSTRLSTSEARASIAAQRQTEPHKLGKFVRGDLDWIVMKALAKERDRRYETANAFAADVEHFLNDEPVSAGPPTVRYKLRKFLHRNKGRVISGGVFAALLFLVVGLVLYGAWWAERQSAEQRHEQATVVARNNDAFNATLDQIEVALKAARLAEAATLMGQADRQLDEQTPNDLRERHERLKRDERTIRELDAIFEERWMVSPTDTRIDSERAKKRYPPLFQAYGLAISTGPAASAVETIRKSVIAEALASGMTEWFFVDPKYPGLLAVVDLLDPDLGRANLRSAIAKDDTNRIKELGMTIDGSKLSPAYAIGLGIHPAVEDGVRILKAAWTAHADSFPLALTISSRSYAWDDKVRIEAVGWGRTAVALRPNNPLAHYYLAIALSDRGGLGGASAVDELRRTIRLAPQFARAYGRLAFELGFRQGRDTDESLAFARKAIELDDRNVPGHYVVYEHLLLSKKDYVEAARVYRLLNKLLAEASEDGVPSDSSVGGYAMGWTHASFPDLVGGLLRARQPFEAYRLLLDFPHINRGMMGALDDDPDKSTNYAAACAAAIAGTGQGLDAPPPTERPAIRKHALEWLNASFDIWIKHAAAPSVLGACTVGLVGSPFGPGPLLGASALFPGRPDAPADPAKNREVVFDGMNRWLSDPNLAGIRDDQWLDKLPVDEREQWRKLWGEVRSLRDQTAPPKIAPPVGK